MKEIPGRLRAVAVCIVAPALFTLLAPTAAAHAGAGAAVSPDPAIATVAIPSSREPHLSASQIVSLLRKRVRYLFVIYQENRSFDSYFGTFPGADGLYSQPQSKTPGFSQPIENVDGSMTTIEPFRIGVRRDSEDLSDVNHSHPSIVAKMDVTAGVPKMDRFALTEERLRMRGAALPSLDAKQFGELSMAHVDGNIIPFLWRYANRFVLCDHIFQFMAGPSTPGNLAIIGAQTGATQWMLHPDEAVKGNGGGGPGVPVENDTDPFWGSRLPGDASGMPEAPKDEKKKIRQLNLAYATVPLTLTGRNLGDVARSDRDPTSDLGDVKDDVRAIIARGSAQFGWGWFQEGFDGDTPIPGDGDGDGVDAEGLHFNYVVHHNGPQYFGYIANNPKMASHMHGLGAFFAAIGSGALNPRGGLYYIKGGLHNSLGLSPANPELAKMDRFYGDDDHPGDSDSQIAEAMIATVINAIAKSKYWQKCAIIITWDDSEGDYDHLPPPLLSTGPDGTITSDGPRVPMIVISPFSRAHAIDHQVGNQVSVIKLADALFDLTPLADLPDEVKGRKIGDARGLSNEGPFDDHVPDVSDLTSCFDPARLAGRAAPLPPSYAEIPDKLLHVLPATIGYGWRQIRVEPTDLSLGIPNQVPPDFSPRP